MATQAKAAANKGVAGVKGRKGSTAAASITSAKGGKTSTKALNKTGKVRMQAGKLVAKGKTSGKQGSPLGSSVGKARMTATKTGNQRSMSTRGK